MGASIGQIGQMAGQGLSQGLGAIANPIMEAGGGFIKGTGIQDFLGSGATFNNGKLEKKGSGLLGWIGENPQMAAGILTGAGGLATGNDLITSAGLGGQAAYGVQSGINRNQAAKASAMQEQAKFTLEQQKAIADIINKQKELQIASRETNLKEQQFAAGKSPDVLGAMNEARGILGKKAKAADLAKVANTLALAKATGSPIDIQQSGWGPWSKTTASILGSNNMSANTRR